MVTIVLLGRQQILSAVFFASALGQRRYWNVTPASRLRLLNLFRLKPECFLLIRLTGQAPYMTGLLKRKRREVPLGLSNTNKVLLKDKLPGL